MGWIIFLIIMIVCWTVESIASDLIKAWRDRGIARWTGQDPTKAKKEVNNDDDPKDRQPSR